MRYSLSNKVVFPWSDAGGELNGATGNIQLGTSLSISDKLGGAGRITPSGPDPDVGDELGIATGSIPSRTNLGVNGTLGVSARNTLSGPGFGVDRGLGVTTDNTPPRANLGAGGKLGDTGRITSPGSDLGAGDELGVTTGNTPPRTNLGANGKLGSADRIIPPGPDLGADGELGVATGSTSSRTNLGASGELGDVGHIASPGPGLGADGELGVATGNTLPDLASTPTGNWMLPLATSYQELISVSAVRLVLRPETLCQVLTSMLRAINSFHPIETEEMCDSVVCALMDKLEFERLLELATLFNSSDEYPTDFTELQELSELLDKPESYVDVAIDNAPGGAGS